MHNSYNYSHSLYCKSQTRTYIWKSHIPRHTMHVARQLTRNFHRKGGPRANADLPDLLAS